MATERELKAIQEARLFDMLEAFLVDTEEERLAILERQIERAKSGMTVEEVAAVRERVSVVLKKQLYIYKRALCPLFCFNLWVANIL